MKPQVLFVDERDESSGLRDAVQSHGEIWGVHWAQGGVKALEHLAQNRVDVLVTDIGMPGMGGVALLEEVRTRYPATARIILSGDAERDAMIAAAGTAQQFLAKPCDPNALMAALESIVATRALIVDPLLRSTLGGPDNLPKPPAIYAELCALANDPHTNAADIARVVERDIATAAELLKLVNSSFFGVVSEVTSIRQAVTLLGLDVIQALIVAGQVFRPTVELPAGLIPADIAGQGIKACVAVRRTGAILGWDEKLTGQVSLAALLHDVGLLVLATSNPVAWNTYREIGAQLPAREAEVKAFGCTIGRASAYILGLWGFHPTIVGALAEQPLALEDDVARASCSQAALIVAEAHHAAAVGAAKGSAA